MTASRVFSMPDLGEGLEEGEIVAWLVAEGDRVTLNQPLVEVETAKATVEIPSPFAGLVRGRHGGVGDVVPVGEPLVTFEIEGGSADDAGPPAEPDTDRTSAGPAKATPPVRKLARSLEVDLSTVEATGPGGRINADDVRRAGAGRGVGAPDTGSHDLTMERLELTPIRRTIAANLSAQAATPQVTTFRTVDCLALEDFRRELGISPLPVVIAALCRTIGAHPLLNARWDGGEVLVYQTVNVGLAVDTERGLMVPVLQGADGRGLADLAAEVTRLGSGARDGVLGLEDLTATATVAVSNTGSYGSEAGTPILSPGTGVTLAVGVIESRPLVVGGEVTARPACTLSCTFDHRVLDGATTGRALTDLVELLENPERLGRLPR